MIARNLWKEKQQNNSSWFGGIWTGRSVTELTRLLDLMVGKGGRRASSTAVDDEGNVVNEGEGGGSLEKQSLLSGPPSFGARHSLALWAFLGFANIFILRVDMSITLVAMATQNSSATGSSQIYDIQPGINGSIIQPADGCQNESSSRSDSHGKAEFDWSNSLQGFILSAFYYGYFLTQIPGGVVAKSKGGKHLFTAAMAGCSALSMLTPLAARIHVGFLIAIRVLQGCLQGVVFPTMQVMLSKWAPPTERSRLVAFTYAGCQAGTVLGLLSAGYLCNSGWGWPTVFYVEGVLSLMWCTGWHIFAFDSPADHPRISDLEKSYIENSIEEYQKTAPSTPWCSILTSPAVYAVAAAHFANDWGSFAVMTCLPKFMKDVLHYDIAQNGLLTSLPYLITWICNIVAGSVADTLRKHLRTVWVRKLMVSIGLLCPAALLVGAAYIPGCGRAPVLALLTTAMGFSGFTVAGHSVNHLDNAPAFAGILFGMTNTFGTMSGFIGPVVAGALTDHNDTRHSWQTFFLISGAVYLVGGLVFVLLARAELQPWATLDDSAADRVVAPPQALTYGSASIQTGDDDADDGVYLLDDDAGNDDKADDENERDGDDTACDPDCDQAGGRSDQREKVRQLVRDSPFGVHESAVSKENAVCSRRSLSTSGVRD